MRERDVGSGGLVFFVLLFFDCFLFLVVFCFLEVMGVKIDDKGGKECWLEWVGWFDM